MNEAKNSEPADGVTRTGLEARLSDLEHRIARLEKHRPAPNGSEAPPAELAQLRQAVKDLAADTLDLNNQLAKVVSSFERILAGAVGGSLPKRSGGGLRQMRGLVGRAARRVARGATAAAQRLKGTGGASGRAAPPDLDVELAGTPVGSAPRVAVVVASSDNPEVAETPAMLRDQSDDELVVVLWNRDAATAAVIGPGGRRELVSAPDKAALAAAVDVELVAELAAPLPRLHPSTVERCRWTVASEHLPLIVSSEHGRSPARAWTLQPVGDWLGPASGDAAASGAQLVKLIGGSGWSPLAVPDRQVIGSAAGRCYLARTGAVGAVTHRIAPLSGAVAGYPTPEDRPAVLVVTSALGGALTAWLVRHLAADHRFTVVVTGSGEATPLVRALTDLADRVYPLDGFLEPAVWPSLLADLAVAHEARAIVRIGAATPVAERDDGPRIIDVPLDASEVDGRADLVLALGSEVAESALRRGIETVNLTPAAIAAGGMPPLEDAAGVRAAYGVSEDARLVVSVCDLEPPSRPEDVAAVARRLRDRRDVHVLLVGTGPLAGTITDLAGYLELERFTFAPPGHTLGELVAASDCVLHTAEVGPWPIAVGTGLALGRSVVATDIDGVRELVAAAGSERSALRPPGDVDGLAAAVVEALERRPKRPTRKAWAAAVARGEEAARSFREAIDGRLGPGASESR